MTKLIWILLLITLYSCNTQKQKWKAPIDKGTLKEWEVMNGDATFQLEGKSIVAYAKMNTRNTFLATKKSYSNFILELDVKVDPRINSGIQIRSHSIPEYHDGVVHGYQVEIDPSDRAWSGGLYEESKRGWINNLNDNPEGRKAFHKTDWNHYRIEAIRDTIRVWVNDVNTSNTIDSQESEGFIALQMHSINDESLVGAKAEWKNIKILENNLDRHKRDRVSNLPYKRYQKQ